MPSSITNAPVVNGYITDFGNMTREEIDRKIKNISDKIAVEYKPEKIILFGSFAWGKPTKDSDIDLLIVKKAEESSRKLAQEIDNSLFEREMPIDILVYSPKYIKFFVLHFLLVFHKARNGGNGQPFRQPRSF